MIKLITHDDKDGVGCYVALRCFYQKSDIDLSYCKYNEISSIIEKTVKEHYKYDKIYLTDISLSIKDVLALNKISDKVKFFDHHKTSLWINEYEWATIILEEKFVLDKDFDSNLYESLKWSTELSNIYKEENAELVPTCTSEIFVKYLYKIHNIKEKTDILKNLDIFIESTRRYDTWEWHNKYNDLAPKKLNDLLSFLGIDRFCEEMISRIKNNDFTLHLDVNKDIYLEKELPIKFTETDNLLLELKEEQFKREVEKKNIQIIHKRLLGYNVGVVFAEKYIFELSHKLAEMNPHFDFVILVAPNYKMFRTVRDDLDMSLIAQEFGGSGHCKTSAAKNEIETTSKMIDVLFK